MCYKRRCPIDFHLLVLRYDRRDRHISHSYPQPCLGLFNNNHSLQVTLTIGNNNKINKDADQSKLTIPLSSLITVFSYTVTQRVVHYICVRSTKTLATTKRRKFGHISVSEFSFDFSRGREQIL